MGSRSMHKNNLRLSGERCGLRMRRQRSNSQAGNDLGRKFLEVQLCRFARWLLNIERAKLEAATARIMRLACSFEPSAGNSISGEVIPNAASRNMNFSGQVRAREGNLVKVDQCHFREQPPHQRKQQQVNGNVVERSEPNGKQCHDEPGGNRTQKDQCRSRGGNVF